jgi:hypothetical protein
MKQKKNNGKLILLSGLSIQVIQWLTLLIAVSSFLDFSFINSRTFLIILAIGCWLFLNGISIWLINKGNNLMKENEK